MKRHTWLHILVPALIILVWFGLASFGGPTFGKLGDVSSNDQSTFLPATAESTEVISLQKKLSQNSSIPAVIVFESSTQLSPSQLGDIGHIKSEIQKLPELQKYASPAVGPLPSQDKKAAELIIPLPADIDFTTLVETIRSTTQSKTPSGVKAYVSGPAGISADFTKAFAGIDGLLLLVAVAAVFVILIIVYRSVLLPILVLLTAMVALTGAILVVYFLAKHNIVTLNGQSQGILSILAIGAATDYSLLLVSRYREQLQHTTDRWEAIWKAIKVVYEPIVASAVTVMLGLLCLLVSDLNLNRSLGPVAAFGILGACLSALTFLPALLFVFGRVAFWPSKPKLTADEDKIVIKNGLEASTGVWLRAGNVVQKHARATAFSIVLILLICSVGITQLKANGVPQTEVILSQSEAVNGQDAIARHYSAGSASPITVAVPTNKFKITSDFLATRSNISSVQPVTSGGLGTAPATAGGYSFITAILRDDPYSKAAQNDVKNLRSDLDTISPSILVGGSTATSLDTNTISRHDLFKVIPLVLLVVLIVLIILLRSVFAPLLLVGTVVLSFAATLGIAGFVFTHIFHFVGADPSVPLFGFVFLVALGVDYNIFLMSRTREESFRYGTRAAILHSLGKTGSVITSAGIVLAATFAALGVIPILFLVQIAFIVAFGVLLDTIIVRSLLVPALVYMSGKTTWWPSHKLQD